MSDDLGEIFFFCFCKACEEMKQKGLSDDEIERIVNDKIDEALETLVDTSARDTLSYMKEHMFEITAEVEAFDAEFLAHQNQKWGKCFAASRVMYVMAAEASELFTQYVRESVDKKELEHNQYTFLALQQLQGRACQEFLEILTLMKAGFADGAYARWRSMFELCCIASFIREHGEQIAKQFYEQSETEEQRYLWTDGVADQNGKKIRTFSQIQSMCDIPISWKKQYKLACMVNHASPQGTFKRLSNGCVINMTPVGRSDYGLITPAEHSAISLQWITATFITLFPHTDSISRAKTIGAWVDVVRDMYFSAHDEIFRELNEEQKTEEQTSFVANKKNIQ